MELAQRRRQEGDGKAWNLVEKLQGRVVQLRVDLISQMRRNSARSSGSSA